MIRKFLSDFYGRGPGAALAKTTVSLDEWISTAQAATLSGYNDDHIRWLVLAGKVKARKFGWVWMVNRPALAAYLRKLASVGLRRGRKPARQKLRSPAR